MHKWRQEMGMRVSVKGGSRGYSTILEFRYVRGIYHHGERVGEQQGLGVKTGAH